MALSLVGGLFFGLGIGLSIGLVVGLTAGLENRPVDQTTYPGQKIVFSIWNFFFVFTVIELIGGLIVLSILNLVGGLTTGLIVILVAVLIIGLSVGINFGGIPVFNHYSLRLLIYTSNHLPRHLVPFLDYCVDLIFLRRVGGGYIFVHRLLMEHFAAMYKEK